MKVKGIYQKVIYGILSVLVCVSLSGCTIGGYHVADVYVDENGEQRFMGFGKTGPSGGEESIENENSTEEVIVYFDIVLGEGEYQLVYVSADCTEQILQDGKVIQSEEKILFTQGQNEISIYQKDMMLST